ncbi:MAG: sensor histidine kinase [Muribaculaceae bacterium]|nr:sensor histidine kinase [Muribaculaceae bacterium]
MKRVVILLMVAFLAVSAFAQSRGESLLKQADQAMAASEYTKARYLYLQAYQAFHKEGNIDKAVPAAVNVAALYHRENYYKEAFDVINAADAALMAKEEEAATKKPALHYALDRERQKMYMKMRKPDKVAEQLARMQSWASQASDSTLTIDLLAASAQQYYMFGQTEKGDAAVNRLIALYENNSDYDKAGQCYKDLIDMATRTGNARIISRTYEKYISWADSVAAVKSDARAASLEQQLEQARADIDDRDSSLTAKTAIIVGLCVLAAILAAVLIIGAIILLRFIALSRRQKKQIETARAHNELKTKFISNISAQLEPTLNTLPGDLPAVKALRGFSAHIQELSDLEASLSELYPTEPTDIAKFCQSLAEELEASVRPGVKVMVDAPKVSAPLSEEPLARVLSHILENAAIYTPEGGKISLEAKKRGPHNIQFIITNTGEPIDPEQMATLFKPFAAVRDLTHGDGLGLPICALLTTKMNGTLSVDESYTSGARFIIELHP